MGCPSKVNSDPQLYPSILLWQWPLSIWSEDDKPITAESNPVVSLVAQGELSVPNATLYRLT